jgi:ATP-binding cassette subfamily F protein uup
VTAILTVQGLEKRFGTRRVLAGASFAVHERDRIGMIGANGAGKSTLLEIVVHRAMGGDDPTLAPDAGLVTWKRDLALEYVAQEPVLDPDLAIGAALARDGVPDHEVATIASALELPPVDQRIATLSLGERRRVALARALLGKADVLALDEPTNHLDATTVEWLETRLAGWPGALIVVTHDRYFLDRVATRILEVDRGKVYGYDGDYAEFILHQAERLAAEAETEYQRASFIRREIDWIRRGPPARTTKAKARIDRFDAAVAAAPTTDDRRPEAPALRLPSGPRLGGTIVELDRVTKSLGGKLLFRDLTLVMKPGDRIGVVGPNGAGKTTLIRTLLGLVPPDAGRVVLGANTRPAYLEQGRSELRDERTVIDEVGDGYDFVELPDGKVHVRSFLRMLAFPDSVADTQVGQLSGGERNRVQLARLLRRGGNLLVLDEPTNDLDLPTLGALEDGLVHFAGCALIVSHDRWFLDRVATAILAFEGDGKVALYEGSYTFYAERRPGPAERAERADRPRRDPRDERAAARSGPRKLTFKEARELEAIEDTIASAEARVAELEAQLSDPGVFKDRPTEVPGLIAGLDAARAEVERLFARWQELDAIHQASPR